MSIPLKSDVSASVAQVPPRRNRIAAISAPPAFRPTSLDPGNPHNYRLLALCVMCPGSLRPGWRAPPCGGVFRASGMRL